MKIIFLLILTFVNNLSAEKPIKKLALSSQADVYQQGVPLALQVDLILNPGWHIYYKSPGKFGLPTKFQLTSGVKTSYQEWQYPEPKEFKEVTGDITLGYDDQASFSLEITPEEDRADPLELLVLAEWLACNYELCVPGEEALKISIPKK